METEPLPALDAVTAPHRVGAVLAEARIAAGLELSDIARESRVPIRHLRAIETDSHEALPALPYAIGFVKSFARAVGKDPETIAAQFRAETTKTAHTPMMAAIEPLDERRLPPRGLMALSILAVLVVIGVVIAYSAGMFGAPVPETAVTTVAAAPDGVGAAPDGIAAGPVAPAPVVPAVAPLPTTGAVAITATEEAWIKVYDMTTKETVKIGILTPGERYDVPDQPNLALWTGKAGVLKLTIGGRELPPLGGPAETVRDVLLAPADLAARAAAPAPTPAAVL